MGKKLRTGDPWMPGYKYGALLPPLSLNLIVSNVERSTNFYKSVLNATVHYSDVDFAAVRVGPAEIMLHADHTHDDHPWAAMMSSGAVRGVGLQIRLLGVNPDEIEQRARAAGATVISAATSKAHGWREILLRDPDGYEWAVGVLTEPAK